MARARSPTTTTTTSSSCSSCHYYRYAVVTTPRRLVIILWISVVVLVSWLEPCCAREFRLRKLLHQHFEEQQQQKSASANGALAMKQKRRNSSSSRSTTSTSSSSLFAEAQQQQQQTHNVHSSSTTSPSPFYQNILMTGTMTRQRLVQSVWHLLQHPNQHLEQLHQLYQQLLGLLQTLYLHVVSLLLYKPPVGMVALALGLRLILTGRLFHWEQQQQQRRQQQQQGDPVEVMLQEWQRQTKKRPKRGRSLELDRQDAQYRRAGGVHMVRGRLCHAALRGYVYPTTSTTPILDDNDNTDASSLWRSKQQREEEWTSLDQDQQHLLYLVWKTVDLVTTRSSKAAAGGSSVEFLQQLIPALSQMECAWLQLPLRWADPSRFGSSHFMFSNSSDKRATLQLHRILYLSILTLQLQSMDALLRLCRDQLVQASFRLARAQEHWKRRLVQRQKQQQQRRNLVRIRDDGINLLQWRFSHAQAAYQAEIQRLGKVGALLLQLPADLSEVWLLQAIKASQEERIAVKKQRYRNWSPRRLLDVKNWKLLPTMSKYSTGWMGGRWFIRRFDRSERQLSAAAAAVALLSQEGDNNDSAINVWIAQAQEWTQEARALLIETVQQTLDGSADSTETTINDWNQTQSAWLAAVGTTTTATATSTLTTAADKTKMKTVKDDTGLQPRQRQQQWYQVLHYVDALSTWRRIGEGQLVRLKDAAILHWTGRLDVFGLPSYAIAIWCAYKFHRWILPYWPRLRSQAVDIVLVLLDIWEARVWIPLIALVDEIMNKSKGMMSALSLETEEMSLDHMLRDMGFGDGSAGSRQSALEHAAVQYEHDLRTGVFVNLASGRLIRLLLVQVQQLKVGLLTALDTIDVLMEGNKIHFQIMAFVPAVLLMYYGTRLLLRALYNIRAKDLRPVNVVHGEMALFLDQMESILMQAQGAADEGASAIGHFSKQERGVPRTPAWLGRWGVLLPKIALQQPEQRQKPVQQQLSSLDLSTAQLGELLLFMHRYLVRLDYCSPPFPPRECDHIHESLQDILAHKKNAATIGVSLLHAIQRKHQSLLKS